MGGCTLRTSNDEDVVDPVVAVVGAGTSICSLRDGDQVVADQRVPGVAVPHAGRDPDLGRVGIVGGDDLLGGHVDRRS